MHLNTLTPGEGAKHSKKRVGRGIGSGLGKTCGRGHKGQKSRSGGFHKVGFEGGQMPLQRRLPKFGFNSYLARVTAEIRLHELNKIDTDLIDMDSLRVAGLIGANIKRAKIMVSGTLNKAVNIAGDIHMTAGAKAAIEAAGGKVATEE